MDIPVFCGTLLHFGHLASLDGGNMITVVAFGKLPCGKIFCILNTDADIFYLSRSVTIIGKNNHPVARVYPQSMEFARIHYSTPKTRPPAGPILPTRKR